MTTKSKKKQGVRIGKARRNPEFAEEWIVPVWVDGVRHEGRTYYCDDREDAVRTRIAMLEEQAHNERTQFKNTTPYQERPCMTPGCQQAATNDHPICESCCAKESG